MFWQILTPRLRWLGGLDGVGQSPGAGYIQGVASKVILDGSDQKIHAMAPAKELEKQLTAYIDTQDFKDLSGTSQKEITEAKKVLSEVIKAGGVIKPAQLKELMEMAVAMQERLKPVVDNKAVAINGADAATAKTALDVIQSDPSLKAMFAGCTSLPDVQKKLNSLDPATRETVMGTISMQVATNRIADRRSADPDVKAFMDAFKACKTEADLQALVDGYVNAGQGDKLKDVLKKAPDMPILNQVQVLDKLGMDGPAVKRFLMEEQTLNRNERRAEAQQVYQKFFGQGDEVPINVMFASGNGTGTRGLLGQTNRGVALFDYPIQSLPVTAGMTATQLYDKIMQDGVIGSNSVSYTPKNLQVDLQLNVTGVDKGYTAGTVTIQKGNDAITLNINNVAQGSAADPNRFRDVTLTINGKKVAGTQDPANPDVLVFKPPMDGTNSFAEVRFNAKNQTLSVVQTDLSDFTLKTTSGTAPARGGGTDYDEQNITVTALNAKPNLPIAINGDLRDNFLSGSFKANPKKPISFDAEEEKALKQFLTSGDPVVINVSGAGHGVGKLVGGTIQDGGATKDGASADVNLRVSGLSVTIQKNQLTVRAESFTDEQKWNGFANFERNIGTKPIIAAKNAEAAQLGKTLDPNDWLSALRTFATMDQFFDKMKKYGMTDEQIKTAHANVKVQMNGVTLTYADYMKFKVAAG